jgi:hypothetical protein
MTHSSTATVTGADRLPAPVAGLDVLSRSLQDVDAVAHSVVRLLHGMGAIDVLVTSHVVQSGDEPHQVVTVSADDLTGDEVEDALQVVGARFDVAGVLGADSYDGPRELRSGLDDAVARHRERSVGRVVVFPGDHLLLGTVSVADATLWSDIDRVEQVTGAAVDPRTPLVTRDFLRPRWQGGELVLHVQPAVGGTVVPFETPSPTPCCADHA